MTRHETIFATQIAESRMVLATDLDGTFLGGSDEDRRRLYDWIEDNRPAVGLIFVTGRDPGFIAELCRERGVPRPNFVVGDVGTTIAEVAPDGGIVPIPALERAIAQAWGDSGHRVRAALRGVGGLALQPTSFRYRVSYDLDPVAFDERAHAIVEGLGLDTLVSDNRYFDVLPKGVSKGPSLLRLLDFLGLAPHRCLAAGDTLNDFSMLATGFPAVAVGGSEPALLARLEGRDSVHRATAIGAAGILEAIEAFELHPANWR